MSEWTKKEWPSEPMPANDLPFDPEAELPPMVDPVLPTDLPEEAVEQPAPAEPPAPEPTPKAEKPTTPKPARNRRPAAADKPSRNRAAAPIGFLVLVLALIGAVSVLISGVRLVQNALDDTPLKTELAAFLKPITLQNPTAFEGVDEAAQNPSCIKAALWKVTETERIRMRQNKAECRYAADEFDRLLIPESEVNAAFRSLFGEGKTPDTSVFAEDIGGLDIWYNADADQYHVPAFSASLYQSVIDTVETEDGLYQVRIGYVAAEDIAVDDAGNDLPPTVEAATMFQYFAVEELDDTYRLESITDAVSANP